MVKKTRTINSRSMEWEWGELPLWSLLLYGVYDISKDVLKVSQNVLCFKCFFFWAKCSVFEKDIIEKSLPKLFCCEAAPKIKPLKSQKHFLKWKFPLKQMQQWSQKLYSPIISLVFYSIVLCLFVFFFFFFFFFLWVHAL